MGGTLLSLPAGGAAAASGAGWPGPLPASPSQPLSASSSAAVSPQEHWEDAGVRSAPAPRFFFLSWLWDLAAGAGSGSPKSRAERGIGVQASAAAREQSWAHGIPGVALGPRRRGWDVTKESPRRLPPALEGAPSSASGARGWSPFSRSAAGRLPGPTLRKERGGIAAFPALGVTPGPAARGWTASRFPPTPRSRGIAARPAARAPRHLRGSPRPGSAPPQRPATHPVESARAAAS